MKNLRNLITVLVLLGVFFWYGGGWAYRSLYKEPREELREKIGQYEQAIGQYKTQNDYMQTLIEQNQKYYLRSLPQRQNSVLARYELWLRQCADFSGIADSEVLRSAPRMLQGQIGMQYTFNLSGEASLDQISRFLYEFYWTPYLHRIVSVDISPIERSDLLNLSIRIEAIALRRPYQNAYYPLMDDLPSGYLQRLSSRPFRTYASIAENNFMQFTRGGLDRADQTYLMFIAFIDGKGEIRLKDRTTDETIIAHIGDTLNIGSFNAKLVEITDRDDVLFEENGRLWLLSNGDPLSKVFAIPPEFAGSVSEPVQ